MKPCPHCGSEKEGFVVHGQMAGPANSYFNFKGEYIELDLDKCYWKSEAAVIRCAKCHKIRHDVILLDRSTIIEKE